MEQRFTSGVNDGRRFTRDHVWIDPDGSIGVTAHLLAVARSIHALHLPALGEQLATAVCFGALEIDKGTIDLFAPCDGRVTERNEAVITEPNTVSPEIWLIRVDGTPGPLMTKTAYDRYAAQAVVSARRGR